jgi:hypothetical protein
MINLDYNEMVYYIESMTEDQKKEFLEIVRAIDERRFYQLNPVQWIEDKLGIKKETIIWSLNPGYEKLDNGPRIMDDGLVLENGWDGTRDPIYSILQGLAEWKDVVVESSTGTGKTFVAALAALWFLAVFPNSKVIMVAPKEDLLKVNLWGEIHRFSEVYKKHYPNADFMKLEIRMDKNWIAIGFVAAVSADEEVSNKAAGFHAEHMLWIMDETQGIDPAILAAIENTCTDRHNLRLALGNPRSTEDPLHQLFKRADFLSIRISSYDHPNIVMNDPSVDLKRHNILVPGAVSWKSLFSRRTLYGPDPEYYNNNALYKALIRGLVPAGSEFSLFTEMALERVRGYLEEFRINENIEPYVKPIYEEILEPFDDRPLEGFVRIYKAALNDYFNRYVLFGDVAEDNATGDWHACVVLDRITLEVVALVHMRGDRKEYAKRILFLAKHYEIYDWRQDVFHKPVVNWERNSSGALHLIDEFAAYPNLYIQRKYDNPATSEDVTVKAKDQRGWFTHSQNRSDMTNELGEWGYTLVSNPYRVPDAAILKEMKTFAWNEKKNRYQHMNGQNDDIMMALAGALITHKILPKPTLLSPVPENEMAHPNYVKKSLFRRKQNSGYQKGGSWNSKKLPKY